MDKLPQRWKTRRGKLFSVNLHNLFIILYFFFFCNKTMYLPGHILNYVSQLEIMEKIAFKATKR